MLFNRLCLKVLLICLTLCIPQVSIAQTKLLILGDSLSAGYGLLQEQSWVNLLQNKWHKEGKDIKIINASISGETTSGGLARLPRLLEQYQPDVVFVELGANDGLRGYPVKKMAANLEKIVETIEANQAYPLVSEVILPSNFGKRFVQMFTKSITDVAAKKQAPLVPFLMWAVADKDNMIQQDGLHPNKQAQPIIAEYMAEKLATAIDGLQLNGRNSD